MFLKAIFKQIISFFENTLADLVNKFSVRANHNSVLSKNEIIRFERVALEAYNLVAIL